MDLDFTSEQEALRDMVRGVCTKHASLDVVRELENDETGYPQSFWSQLAELGLLGLTIPEKWGGSGMSMVEGMIVYTELGRALAPSPHFASAVISGGLITAGGTDEQRQEWLPKIASGEAILTPAWLEPDRGFGPKGIALEATADGDGYTLTGVKRHVPFAKAADRLVVLARTAGSSGADGLVMALVDPNASGVTLTQQQSIASDTQFRVELNGVRVAAADVIGGSTPAGWAVFDEVMHDGIILLAAQAIGGARYALDITVQYSKDRQQFDKPLGAFQALAHNMADAVTNLDGAETIVWEAAWAKDTGKPVNKLAPMAKLMACNVFRDVTAMGQQIFGGVGFTVDYDIQLYFRRAKNLQLTWWDTRYLENLIAAAVLD